MLQWWQAVGNTVFDLTDLRFEPQTSCFRDERVALRRTGSIPILSNECRRKVLVFVNGLKPNINFMFWNDIHFLN